MNDRTHPNRRGFLKGTGAAALGVLAGSAAVGARPGSAVDARKPWLSPTDEFDFDEVISRVGTESRRWDKPVEDLGTPIEAGMGIADMDFRAPHCVTRALEERCAHENWGYQHRGPSYAEAVAAWNRRRYGLEVDPETVVFTTGVHPGLIAALHTFSPPGTRVLLLTPTYSGFYTDTSFTRTVAEDCPLVPSDGGYAIDFDDFERRARRCNSFILCNPQNPTGNCWSPEDLLRLGEICLRRRVVVLADEIHCDFVTRGNSYTPFASLPDQEIVDNSVTFSSGSKSFSLAAMKVAWYHTTNRDYLTRIKENTRADLSTLGMIAMRAALTEGDAWLDELVPYLDANHDLAETYVTERLPMVGYRKAEGTYLAWLEVSELSKRIGARETARRESAAGTEDVTPEEALQRWLAVNARVFLNPGSSYGTGGAGRMRLNLASPRSVVEKALDNISAAVELL